MFGQPFYLGHLGRTPVYVGGDVIFLGLLVWFWHGRGGIPTFLTSLVALLLTIVFHEGAHAAAARVRGMTGMHIVIGGLGGYCAYRGERRPGSEALISLAGPLTNGALGWAAWLAIAHAPPLPGMFGQLLVFFCFWNIALAIFNILPIYPQDGGQALYNGLRLLTKGTAARRLTLSVSFATAIAAVAWIVWYTGTFPFFVAIVFALSLYSAYRDLR